MSKSPTQNTLSRCRESGWQTAITEYWHSFSKRRRDLFGFIDVIALLPKEDGGGVLGIQATSMTNVSARVHKILENCDVAAKAWLDSGGRIQVWGWGKKKTKGDDGRFWQVRVVEITRESFPKEDTK